MKNDIWEYFKSKYEKADFRVVPGHWPDFKSKNEVDEWIRDTEKQLMEFAEYAKFKKINRK